MQQILDLIFLNNEEQKPTKPPRPSPLYLFISNTQQSDNHKNVHYFFYHLNPLTKSN